MRQNPLNLEAEVAFELKSILEDTPIDSEFKVEPSGRFLALLEYYIPLLLSHHYSEWEQEGLDGFYITSARKTGPEVAELYGWAILLNDSGVTPFFIHLAVSSLYDLLDSYQLFLGEVGHGRLGISIQVGAGHLIETLHASLNTIPWKYIITSEGI